MQNKTGQSVESWINRLERQADELAERRRQQIYDRLADDLKEIWPPTFRDPDALTAEDERRLVSYLLELSPAERVVLRADEAGFLADYPGLAQWVEGLDGFGGGRGREFYRWSEGRPVDITGRWHAGYLADE